MSRAYVVLALLFLGGLVYAVGAIDADRGEAGSSVLTVNIQNDTADGVCDASCSVRDAFIEANSDPDVTTIMLPDGTHTLSIAGTGENASMTGDLDVTSPIILTGAGRDTSVVDGGQLDGVIFVHVGASLDASNLKITNGRAGVGAGGIFADDDAPLTLSNVRVSGNSGFSTGVSDADGGVGSQGPLTVRNSIIELNAAEASESSGGVYVGGTATITDSQISSNTAQDDNSTAGIFVDGNATITNTEISGNNSQQNQSTSGLFTADASNVVVTNSTISFNTGNGTENSSAILAGMVTFNNVRVENNTATAEDSAAGIAVFGNVTINRSIIAHNEAQGDDSIGGMFTEGLLTIADSIIDDNSAGNSSVGGLEQDDTGTLTLVRSAITNNSTGDNGDGGAQLEGIATLVNVTVSGNTAGNFATAGLTADGTVELLFTTITNNVATGPTATGGLSNFGELHVANTIVAADNTPLACFQTAGSSDGYNLDGGTSCGFNQTGDQQSATTDLGPLADNGGFSMTHLPGANSDALDAAGECPLPAADQRLYPRPQGPMCDVGAVEVGIVATTGRKWGDINCNNLIAPDDAMVLLGLTAGLEFAAIAGGNCPDGNDTVLVVDWFLGISWGSVNCDGAVDAHDALSILRYVSGIALTPPRVCPPVEETVEVS